VGILPNAVELALVLVFALVLELIVEVEILMLAEDLVLQDLV